MTDPIVITSRQSWRHGLLSLIVPGLGQFVAGARTRGITLLISALTLFGLSIWTIAQKARFPDYGLSQVLYIKLALATGALLIFLLAVRYLLARTILRDPASEAFSIYGVILLFFVALIFVGDSILATAGSAEQLAQIHTGTALYSAAALAALWIWQIADAARVGALTGGQRLPSLGGAILIMCLLVFALGYNITGIDLPKAISEYQDIGILVPRILWPWKAAFAYDQEAIEETQRIQAPCPEGAVGPPPNEPVEGEPWISATPTCGQLSERPISGGFVLGTELTINGGNFPPGQILKILWKNPIGNAFTPRGVGPTEITVDENGEFTTELNIPDAVVPSDTSLGAQIHTLVVRQESAEVFGWRLSEDMNLALIGMLETIMIGLMATFFGIIAAFPLSFLAAKNLMAPIVSPLERLVGNLAGFVVGVWLGWQLTQQAANSLGGLDQAPVPIFLIGLVALLGLGYAGILVGGRLSGWLLGALGKNISFSISALLLGVLVAVPGYYLGLGFSRGIRAIVVGDEVAALTEAPFAYAGALLLFVLAIIYFFRKRNSQGVAIGLIIYAITRTIFNIVRSVEALIYAIIAAIWVGLGPFAGTIALTVHTVASLAKLYSEAIESIDPGPLEALNAVGANRLQTIVYAVVPQIMPPAISFTVYRWDINVRMSTLIGFVGGGGIGFILLQWIRLYRYESVGIAVWLIAITVSLLDYISSAIRERFV